jgi:hypothetical protein
MAEWSSYSPLSCPSLHWRLTRCLVWSLCGSARGAVEARASGRPPLDTAGARRLGPLDGGRAGTHPFSMPHPHKQT